MARYRPDGFTLLLLGLSLLGVGLVLLREATYGVALHWDSVNYISVARNILAGEGFVEFTGKDYTRWPPLYPLVLAGASLFVFDSCDVAGPLNAAAFGLTIFIAGRWLRQHLESNFLALWGVCAVALSMMLAWMSSWALSETLFIVLVTLTMVQTERFLSQGRDVSLVGAAAFTALACLTRYLGVTLAGAVILLLIFQRGVAAPEKLRRIAVYSLISLAPVGLWMLRNFLLVGQPTGDRESYPNYALWEVLDGIRVVAERSLFLDLLPEILRIIAVIITGIAGFALAAAVGYVLISSLRKAKTWTGWRPFCVSGVFALAYTACLIAAMMIGNTRHGVQTRFLVPAYLPLLFAGVFALDGFLSYARRPTSGDRPSAIGTFIGRGIRSARRLPWWAITGALLLCLWLAYSAALHIYEIRLANTHGFDGYSNSKWADSEALEYLRAAPADGVIMTNIAVATYIHADHHASPAKHRYLLSGYEPLREQLDLAADGDYVVWFYDQYVNAGYGYDAMDLRSLPNLRVLAELSDGIVLKVDKS